MSSIRAVGIDVSATTLHVAAEGRDVARFVNGHDGFKKLVKYITKGRIKEVRVVVEATGSYHIDLACYVQAHKKCSVMVVNPRTARAFQAANGGRAKTDRVDALALMAFAQRMEFKPWIRPSKTVMELRSASRRVDQLVKDQTRAKNRIEAANATETTDPEVLASLVRHLEFLALEVEVAKRHLLKLATAQDELATAVGHLSSTPGIAKQTAAQLVAEFEFLDREMTSKQIAAWAGLDPLPYESGSSVRGRRGMSKRGNARVRAMLFMSAMAASRKEGTAMHDLKTRVAARSGKTIIGLGAVMRKLLIVAWAMYRTGQDWDEKKVRPRQKTAKAA